MLKQIIYGIKRANVETLFEVSGKNFQRLHMINREYDKLASYYIVRKSIQEKVIEPFFYTLPLNYKEGE